MDAQTLFYENFETPNTAFDATPYYKNTSAYCNGYIRPNANVDCYGISFVNTLTKDVTTGTGNFLFNSTFFTSGSDLYTGEVWGTVNLLSVKPNTYYTFSFYLANAFSSNSAQIEPFINETSLATTVSATGSGNTSWQKFSFCWNSGNATTADLSLRNLRNTGIGNDFALDDIKFDLVSQTAFTQKLTLCKGQNIKVGSNIYTQTGSYVDFLKASTGCDSVITTQITTIPFTTRVQTIQLPINQTLQIGTKIYACNGIFLDTLKSISGCDSVLLTTKIISSTGLGISNVFSPNGDNINDVFYIFSARCVKSIKRFDIYNRWGNLVFSQINFLPNDPTFGWDGTYKGKMLNTDVFVYWFEVENQDGTSEIFKGDVTLIR
jgi:gliding motility-associated-like protein